MRETLEQKESFVVDNCSADGVVEKTYTRSISKVLTPEHKVKAAIST